MILRRTFNLPPLAGDTNHPQIIVTFDDYSGDLIVGHRHNPWEEWSRPLDLLEAADDEPLPGNRGYGPGGRTYPAVPADQLDAPGPDAGEAVPADAEQDD